MSESRYPRREWKVLLLAGVIALPSLALAAPKPGEPLPRFTGEDLLGRTHTSQEYVGQPTLLIAITDKNAGDEMRHWFETADSRISKPFQHESIISLHLPFFVGINAARSRVKDKVPRPSWDDTLFDRDGTLAKTLGLKPSKQPYVFVLDENGRVLARANGSASSPEAQRIWSALDGSP
jgi:hypothetical protein